MAKRLKPRFLGSLAFVAFVLLAACTSSVDQDTPTPVPSVTPESRPEPVVASCGGPIEHSGSEPLTAIFPQRDGYLWTLADGTDANVAFKDILAQDTDATDSTELAFPTWSRPVVSPDQQRSAVVVQRRMFGSSPDNRTIVVLSDTESPVAGTLRLPDGYAQPLVTLTWLPDSGCLAVLVFEPVHKQLLYVLQLDGEVIAQFQPKVGRGNVIDLTATGWIVLDRLTWDIGELELFSIANSGTTIVVGSGEVIPDFPGLPGRGLRAEQFVASLRN